MTEKRVQLDRFRGERGFFERYPTISDLVRDIDGGGELFCGERQSGRYVHHLKEDIHFYLGEFLKHCIPGNIIGVICTESLSQDMKALFGIDVTSREMKNPAKDQLVAGAELSALKHFLKADYDCVQRLFDLGLIDERKHEILMA